MKVYIRFLRQGLAKVDAPKNFKKMTDKEKLYWADDIIQQVKDTENGDLDILKLMADFDDPENNGYFDEAPSISAIESAEKGHEGDIIVQTKDWFEFLEGR